MSVGRLAFIYPVSYVYKHAGYDFISAAIFAEFTKHSSSAVCSISKKNWAVQFRNERDKGHVAIFVHLESVNYCGTCQR